MPSNFRRNSLKTNKRDTNKVSHFFDVAEFEFFEQYSNP